MGPIVRAIGSGIGLASEAIAAHKIKKSGQAGQFGFVETSTGERAATVWPGSQDKPVVQVSKEEFDDLTSRRLAVPVEPKITGTDKSSDHDESDTIDDEVRLGAGRSRE